LKKRIVLIGAGSLLYSRQIAGSLMDSEDTAESELVLQDIDLDRVGIVCRYIQKLAEKKNSPLFVRLETDRGKALENADFVIVTVAIGGLAMKKLDVEICAAHGVLQVKGDTTGPAGVFRALRSIPFFLELAADMERICPNALLINVSNPLSTITGAIVKYSRVRTIGLCTSVLGMERDFAQKLGVSQERLTVVSAGVNHFTWLTDLYLDGKQRMDLLRDVIVPDMDGLPVTCELFRAYGMFPIPGYKYASEFFLGCEEAAGFSAFNAEAAKEEFSKAMSAAGDELSGKRPFTLKHGGMDSEVLVALMKSAAIPVPGIYTLNCPNRGQLPWLPEGCVTEGPAYVCGDCISPLCPGNFTGSVKKLLSDTAYRYSLTVEAAVNGGRREALDALYADPLVPSIRAAIGLLEDFLRMQGQYLPQFAAV